MKSAPAAGAQRQSSLEIPLPTPKPSRKLGIAAGGGYDRGKRVILGMKVLLPKEPNRIRPRSTGDKR